MTAPIPDAPTPDAIARRIAGFIADTTGLPPDDIEGDVNLGAYGLTSTAAVTLIGVLEDAFALTLSPTLIFEHPTIDELAHAVAGHAA